MAEALAPTRGWPRRPLRAIASLYPLFLVVIAWEATARLGLMRPLFLPAFSTVMLKAWQLLGDGEIVLPLLTSLFRATAGFLLAAAVGVTVGFLMARSRWLRWLLDPLVALGFPAPKIAFIPIFILWFGIDNESKILLVAFNTMFPIIVSAFAGARNVATNQIWAARAMGDSELGLLRRVVFPASLPSLMSGMRIAVPVALLTEFTAEMVAGGGGVGGAEVLGERYLESPTVYVYLIVMLIAGYAIDTCVSLLRKRILRWHEDR